MSAPRLLFVEDEVLIQIVAEEDLKLQGFDVVVAGTAQAALNAAKSQTDGFAAAIIDVGLPDRGGDALAEELRAMASNLPIVIVSGYDKDVLGGRSEGDPLVKFVRKPYRSPQLIAALASVNVAAPK
jgi:DNA-binding response OmpR family regulator